MELNLNLFLISDLKRVQPSADKHPLKTIKYFFIIHKFLKNDFIFCCSLSEILSRATLSVLSSFGSKRMNLF